MDEKQREDRRSANRKFMNSLHELESVLQSDERGAAFSNSISMNSSDDPISQAPFLSEDVGLEALLDEAAQDIERFMSECPDVSNQQSM